MWHHLDHWGHRWFVLVLTSRGPVSHPLPRGLHHLLPLHRCAYTTNCTGARALKKKMWSRWGQRKFDRGVQPGHCLRNAAIRKWSTTAKASYGSFYVFQVESGIHFTRIIEHFHVKLHDFVLIIISQLVSYSERFQ